MSDCQGLQRLASGSFPFHRPDPFNVHSIPSLPLPFNPLAETLCRQTFSSPVPVSGVGARSLVRLADFVPSLLPNEFSNSSPGSELLVHDGANALPACSET